MHRVYSSRRGIEFRGGVKQKIFAALFLIFMTILISQINLIMEYVIAGF